MIETDGVSCSILMLRNDMIAKRIPNIKVGSNSEQYIDELTDYTNIKNKKIVCIDPGNKINRLTINFIDPFKNDII